ncbi:MAG TPA: asparagine synthase (glutamine-hydrolyzing) [Steroidobacteraceae bacterium]|jgi:asparagine synthase (glutamine-hydrolysing)
MCGLVGFLSCVGIRSEAAFAALARRMIARLRHRGPDDEGVWVDARCGVTLGHSRLSILDLSSHGAQPMRSHSGRYLLAYNGEIYNHTELRAELDGAGPGVPWRGHSDTETILAAVERWGLHEALARLNGMFAFALWDREERQLHLARDRFGEKPLYYALEGGCFLFASELKGLLPHPAFTGEIDRGALRAYMRSNYVPTPFTIYRAARKLPPASVLTVAVDPVSQSIAVGEPRTYWSALDVALAARERRLTNVADAKEQLHELLSRSVRSRMLSDVPLGAFLSGGIDSSLIVAHMQQQTSRPVSTFTVGFEDPSYDESVPAAQVAAHLGTSHTCEQVTPVQAREAILRMPAIYDEPFADSSQIPTYLVAGTARKYVKVALTGDGGDELFGGYHRYFVGQRAFPLIQSVPGWARGPLASLIRTMPPASWEVVIGWVRSLIGQGRLAELSGERLHRLARQLGASSEAHMYEIIMTRPEDETVPLAGCDERPPTGTSWPTSLPAAEAMMLFDTLNILPDDFLTKVDRAAMAVSLETRAPFLDPLLFEFAWRMPLEWRIERRVGKVLLREILRGSVPPEIATRPKQGFGIPVGAWLKGPLRPWAESLLEEGRLRREGYLSPGPIRRKWAEHLAGTHDRQSEIWAAVVFQEWLAARHESPAAALSA